MAIKIISTDTSNTRSKLLIAAYVAVSKYELHIKKVTIAHACKRGENTLIECSVACTITIPNDTQDAGWPIGSMVEVRQTGTGQVTITKDAEVTMVGTDSQFKSRVQWSTIMIEKRAAN